ncbi:hypothetical protein [Fluviicola taffensis]|uniref:Transmembrane protein n=1 Tax=Fluviicola taffensis (strain DSM 16823 / NCIMB 13979 / RW262) TaxID=755732 RepID=F2IGD7_FLUTR|nr:hypothetical protein [Fluviicola taffensis]AEA45803.1 hypothetical protein Fluta_3837 [Fluviicola taffensis DSM 16823]
MTIRTFWHLILKTLGIWLFINGMLSLPTLIYAVTAGLRGGYSSFESMEIAYFILAITFYLLVLQFLILKSQWTIDFLKLEKGFEETHIDLTLPYNKLLRIVIIIIGGILFIRAIPSLIEDLYLFITGNLPFSQSPKAISLIVGAAQAIVGFLVMNNSDIVQRYINKKSGDAESKQLDKEEF